MRTSLLTVLSTVACALLLATPASASAGRMTIEQVSNTNQLSTWVLSTPAGETITDSRGEYAKVVDPIVGGTYAIKVTPLRKAYTTIVVYRDNEVIRKAEGSNLSFTVREDSEVRVVITHRFFGTILVTSDPPGQDFVIKGGDTVVYTGTTPAGFNSVPPLYYTVEFDHTSGCRTPRNQRRLLDPNESLFFHGVYDCRAPLTVGDLPKGPVEEEEDKDLLEVSLTTNQAEILAGGTVHYTLTILNKDKQTAEDLTVSVQYDPTTGTVDNIRNDGQLERDLIIWQIPKIYAGRRWSTTFSFVSNDQLAAGDRIPMTVRVSGEGLLEAGVLEEVLTQEIGVTLLPQTGSKAVVVLLSVLAGLFIIALSNCQKRLVRAKTYNKV